jgi:hypothetical protein
MILLGEVSGQQRIWPPPRRWAQWHCATRRRFTGDLPTRSEAHVTQAFEGTRATGAIAMFSISADPRVKVATTRSRVGREEMVATGV